MTVYCRMEQFRGHPYGKLIERLVRDEWWVRGRNNPRDLMRTKMAGGIMPYGYRRVEFPVFNEAELERWHILDVLCMTTLDRNLKKHLHWLMNVLVIQAMDRDAFKPQYLVAHMPLPDDLTYEGFSPSTGFNSLDLNFHLRGVELYSMVMKGGH